MFLIMLTRQSSKGIYRVYQRTNLFCTVGTFVCVLGMKKNAQIKEQCLFPCINIVGCYSLKNLGIKKRPLDKSGGRCIRLFDSIWKSFSKSISELN